MLPKYHHVLNFIEFFWGAMKKYLQEQCDYTYAGLQKNIPDAMASVDMLTIRKWEHHMIRWMDAYQEGNGTKEAQIQVKKFGSCKQSSPIEFMRLLLMCLIRNYHIWNISTLIFPYKAMANHTCLREL